MKKISFLALCTAVLLFVSNVSFAQEAAQVPTEKTIQDFTVDEVVTVESETPVHTHALPFGYPPYPTVGGNPALGVPYSYPRAPRRLGARLFAPRMQHQPFPLPTPGAVRGAVPPFVNPAPPMFHKPYPPIQGTLGVHSPHETSAKPNVYYRPTPVKNFMSLMMAPRPYIGYNPYGGTQPAPVQPQQ